MKFLKRINESKFLFRLLDISFSIFFLLLFSPILIVFAILIKLGDLRAPVFADNHFRVGKEGNLFFMYKFRTMVPNAHELLHKDPDFSSLKERHDSNGAKLKISEDIRVTKIGAFLRKLDIDELPQLFNVLKGNMSMVGPRAYFSEEIESYSKKYPGFKKKIKVVLRIKPGITGLWQISGRNLLKIPQRIRLDYEYSKKKSIIFYILILLKTPFVVLTRYGAYE